MAGFNPETAVLDNDPDADMLAKWIKGASPGTRESARKAAAEGIVAAFKSSAPADDVIREILHVSAGVLPRAARRGLRRAWYQAKRSQAVDDVENYWAGNAKQILNEKFKGRGSWRAQTKGWLKGLTDHVNRSVGVREDDGALAGLRDVAG